MNTSPPAPQKKLPKQRQSKHDDKLETILREAAILFSERGYEGTSLDHVADAVHIHKATLYHYIGSKEEILYQCLVRSFNDYTEIYEEIKSRSHPPLQRLIKFFNVLIEAQTNEFGRCNCLVTLQPLSAETSERIRSFQRELDLTVRNLLEEGMADGSIRKCDARLTSAMIFGAFNWVPRWRKPNSRITTTEIARQYLDIFINGIATTPIKF